MRAVQLAGPVPDPEHVRRAVVPVAGQRVASSEGLLVREDERFVARVEVDALQRTVVVQVDAARPHERERTLDLVGDDFVALALQGVRDELLVPRVHATERGEAARRKGAQQVERRNALVIGSEHSIGVRSARVRVEGSRS